MQPAPSKRARFNTPLVSPPAAAASNYGSYYSSQFLLLPPLPLPYKNSSALCQPFLHAPRPYQPHLSSPIGLEGASHLLFAACRRAEEENKAESGVIPEEESEVDANEAYLYSSSENSGLDIDSSSSSSEDDDDDHWKDVAPGFQKETRSSWIDAGSSSYAKEKLVKILARDLSIPKQQWSFCRIFGDSCTIDPSSLHLVCRRHRAWRASPSKPCSSVSS